ncbi:unnamed protein product [Gadus morhua 'NCC']
MGRVLDTGPANLDRHERGCLGWLPWTRAYTLQNVNDPLWFPNTPLLKLETWCAATTSFEGMTSSQQDSPQAMSTEQALDPALLGEVVRLLKQQDQGLAEPEGLRHERNHQQHAFKTLL